MDSATGKGYKPCKQLVLVIVIMVLPAFLNWFCDNVLFKNGYPRFLSISAVINTSDLMIGVFTAQVAMVSIAIAFSGLLMQLFSSSDKYLGMSMREVILSRPIYGFSILFYMGASLFSSLWSYYLVSQGLVGAVLSIFALNIFIVYTLFRCYIRSAIVADETKHDIRYQITRDLIDVTDLENAQGPSLLMQDRLAKVNEPIKALRSSISYAVDNNNWIDFSEYSLFLMDVTGRVLDRSISPNRSGILRSLFDIVIRVSVLLLRKGECKQFSDFSAKMINQYYEREKENERDDNSLFLMEDILIYRYSIAIYDEISQLTLEGHDIYQHVQRLDCLKKLHFLFTKNGNPAALHSIITAIFDAIKDNVLITDAQRQQIVRDSVKELFRISERDLNELSKPPYDLDRGQVFDSYVYDWTSILREFYINKDRNMIELVFSFISSTTIGNDIIENCLYPCLAINLAMIDVTSPQLADNANGSLLSFNISGKHAKYNGIYHYISSQQLLKKRNLLRISYLSMIEVVEVWNQKFNRLRTFDYSPERFLILVFAFLYEPDCYQEMLKWTIVNTLPRCDRFPTIIDEIKESISGYPHNESNTTTQKVFVSFTNAFEFAKPLLENDAPRITTNLDELKKEAISLLKKNT